MNQPQANEAAKPAIVAPIKLQPVQDSGEFSALLDSDRFAQIQRVAKLFSESDLVPTVFQGKPANCAVALQMAFRMRVDPMMLMQNMYIVHGRPGIEAKLAIALMNSRGPFTGPLQWKVEGEGEKRSWTCYATHRETGEKCEATVTWAMVKAEGWHLARGAGERKQESKWSTLPDLMGRYRSAMFLGRLYCPEVLLGLPTEDELEDIGERAVEGERLDEPRKPTVERIKDALRKREPETVEQDSEAPTFAYVADLYNVAFTAQEFELADDLARTIANANPKQGEELEGIKAARLKQIAAQAVGK